MSSEPLFQSSQKSCSSSNTSFQERRIQRFRDWRSPNSQTWSHAIDVWNQSLKNETNHAAPVNENDSSKAMDPLERKLMDVLASLTSLKDFALLRGREQPSTKDVKQSLDNLAEVSEKLLRTASSIQSQFESNEKQSNGARSESPSFLNEVEVRTDPMNSLIEAVKLLQDEVQRLPELIEASKKKFQEELAQFYEEQFEKALSNAIETCLTISKEKIDQLTSFVIGELPELQH